MVVEALEVVLATARVVAMATQAVILLACLVVAEEGVPMAATPKFNAIGAATGARARRL